MTQVEAGVRRELRPQSLDGFEQMPCIIATAKAGLPGPGGGVKNRRDAISDCLPVRYRPAATSIGKIDPGRGMILPLERIAMQIDDFQATPADAGVEAK